MEKKVIKTDKAPAAIGPYSQAIESEGIIYTSGQLPIDPATGKVLDGTIEEQAHQVFLNLAAIVEHTGGTLSNVVKTTVYLKDISDFQAVNAIYSDYFNAPYPARSAFQVAALPLGAAIEVEAIIHR